MFPSGRTIERHRKPKAIASLSYIMRKEELCANLIDRIKRNFMKEM